jgi:CheY-like chemotaxis protein
MVIIVVDDDEYVRRALAELLEDSEFLVLEAASGREALALARDRAELDLVITDVNMPEMDGMELVEELKSMRPSLPVILMSGRPHQDRSHPFLAKPFTLRGLLACIANATAQPVALPGERELLPEGGG